MDQQTPGNACQNTEYKGLTMSYVQLKGVHKNYGSVQAVRELHLDIRKGEFVSLLGPSGCGKTTILRMLAGFIKPSAGEILIDGQTVFSQEQGINLPPEERQIGMVFQTYAVWPHMSVYQNIAYPLKLRKESAQSIQQKVSDALQMVHLDGFDKRFPHELSGGQQQRVALARALVAEPSILLLDEPLSGLDAKLREVMVQEIKTIWQRTGITVVYVTHDQREAMALSDRILLLQNGQIEQSGSPHEIYQRPDTLFAADFLGKANLVQAIAGEDGIFLTEDAFLPVKELYSYREEEKAHFLLRPENLQVHENHSAAEGLPGVISYRNFFGSFTEYKVKISDDCELRVETDSEQIYQPGQSVLLTAKKANQIKESESKRV